MTRLDDLAAALDAAGFPFLTWADWHPTGDPSSQWTKLHLQGFPATRHWVHHSVTSATTPPAEAARDINAIGISRFGKMSYPFLIHASGTVIQGCYPYIGAHTAGYNSTSLAGCNIGNYDMLQPPQRLLDANVALIRALRETGHYAAGSQTPVYGHRQSPTASTACPGKYLYARLPEIRRLANATPPTPEPPDDPDLEEPIVPTLFQRIGDGAALFYNDGKLLKASDDEIQAGANVAVVPVKPAGFTRVVKAFGPVID